MARELRKQGLTPVYVGPAAAEDRFDMKLPILRRGKRRDVLFFTQELSTLLNAGVPLDRALTITSELTERPEFRSIVLDMLRVLKGGKSLADSWPRTRSTSRTSTSTWCGRARRAARWPRSSSG